MTCGVSMPMLETFEDEPKPKAATASPPQMKVNEFKLHHYFLPQEKVTNWDCLQYFFVFIYLIALRNGVALIIGFEKCCVQYKIWRDCTCLLPL